MYNNPSPMPTKLVLLGILLFLNVIIPIIDVIFRPNSPLFALFVHRTHYFIWLAMVYVYSLILHMIMPPSLWYGIGICIVLNMVFGVIYLYIDSNTLKYSSVEAERASRLSANYKQQIQGIKIAQIICNGIIFLMFLMMKNEKPASAIFSRIPGIQQQSTIATPSVSVDPKFLFDPRQYGFAHIGQGQQHSIITPQSMR